MKLPQDQMVEAIRKANQDESVQGIVVQLPLDEPSETEAISILLLPRKMLTDWAKKQNI
jgi:5,10-methylene-tetrahydrofolate dehydrogenase/methenyl tetrahydrofolate cyclohydrolase